MHYICVFCFYFQSVPATPSLVVNDASQWELYYGEVQLLNQPLKTFTGAVEVLFSAFWIFNIVFPKPVNNTCSILQKYVFRMKEPVPGVVDTLANKLRDILKDMM